MKVLISPDKFKGSLNALDVSLAIKKGLKKNYPNTKHIIHPMADGGDGSLEIIKNHNQNAEKVTTRTLNPIHKTLNASYLKLEKIAYIELATASGLTLLTQEQRNVMETSTIGTGKLIKHAIKYGAKEIILTIGGSATNDAGLGIANALGYVFLDNDNKPVKPTGGNMLKISKIQAPTTKINASIKILCDVTNTFYGKSGAAYCYARQKGADDKQIEALDKGLKHIAKLIRDYNGKDISNIEGSGAAGGVAGGLLGLTNATLVNGFDYLSETTNLTQKIQSADIVITGEGRLDSQSLDGKVVGKTLALCTKYQKPLYIIAGDKDENLIIKNGKLIKGIYTIMEIAKSVDDAMQQASNHLTQVATKLLLS